MRILCGCELKLIFISNLKNNYYENRKINNKQLETILSGNEEEISFVKDQGKEPEIRTDPGKKSDSPSDRSGNGEDVQNKKGLKGGKEDETHRDKLPDETGTNEDSERSLGDIPAGDVPGNETRGKAGTKPDSGSKPELRGDAKGDKISNGKEQPYEANGGINCLGNSGSDVDNDRASTGTRRRGKWASGNTKRTKQNTTGNKQTLINNRITDDSLIAEFTFIYKKHAISKIEVI